jgi:hypothetical protein
MAPRWIGEAARFAVFAGLAARIIGLTHFTVRDINHLSSESFQHGPNKHRDQQKTESDSRLDSSLGENGMTKYTDTDTLIRLCDLFSTHPSYEYVAAALSVSTRSIFGWISASRQHERIKATESPLKFSWNGNEPAWLYQNLAAARRVQIIALEGELRHTVTHGRTVKLYEDDKVTPRFAMDVEAMAFWNNDLRAAQDLGGLKDFYLRDANGNLVHATEQIVEPATLRIKTAEASIPGWHNHTTVDIKTENKHVVRISGGANTPALPPMDVGEKFTALIDAARAAKAEAAKHLADPSRVTRPENGNLNPAYNGNSRAPIAHSGQGIGSDKIEQDRQGRTTGRGPVGFNVERGNGRT